MNAMIEAVTKQADLYAKLHARYVFADTLTGGCDYFKVGVSPSDSGVTLYAPNDETMSSIVAVHEGNKLATYTGFYDTDDLLSKYPDYHQVLGQREQCILCYFEAHPESQA